MDSPTTLPALPDIAKFLEDARKHRTYYMEVRDEAQAEINRAEEVIRSLTGGKRRQKQQRRGEVRHTSPEAYKAVLEALGEHKYAGVQTLRAAGFSASTCYIAMREAGERGHVQIEKRGNKYKYILLDAGLEFLTCSTTQSGDQS